jgi:hypothetical protein
MPHGFQTFNPKTEQPHTHALDRTATGNRDEYILCKYGCIKAESPDICSLLNLSPKYVILKNRSV